VAPPEKREQVERLALFFQRNSPAASKIQLRCEIFASQM